MIGPKFIGQQDSDPKHTAKVTENYLQRKEEREVLEVMAWPPQKPDLNINECVWNEESEGFDKVYIHRRTMVDFPRCLEQLTSRVPSTTVCQSRRRTDGVLKAEGGHTKY